MIEHLRKIVPKPIYNFVHALRRQAVHFRSVNFATQKLSLCNFCGEVFRPIGPCHIEYLSCPNCHSNGRERFMYHCLLESARSYSQNAYWCANNALLKSKALLEFSPRNFLKRRKIYEVTFAQYVASDFDQRDHIGDLAIDLCKEEDIAPLNGSFDIVLFSHVLEHIPDYETAIKNLRRILKPDGFCVLQVPIQEESYKKVTWDEFHGDKTKVFHRFGFDLESTLKRYFSKVTLHLVSRNPKVSIDEININKYSYLDGYQGAIFASGEETNRLFGFGPSEYCDAFVLRP